MGLLLLEAQCQFIGMVVELFRKGLYGIPRFGVYIGRVAQGTRYGGNGDIQASGDVFYCGGLVPGLKVGHKN